VLHQISPKLLKTIVAPSKEEFITITKYCRTAFEVPTTVNTYGLGCFTLPVVLEEQYIGETLGDSGVNANLTSLVTAEKL